MAAIYVSQLARKIVDKNIFLQQPKEVLLQFALILLVGVGVSYLYQYCINGYAIALSYRLKNLGMERLTKCSYASIGKEHSSAVINKLVHDISEVSSYISGGFPEFIGNMIMFLSFRSSVHKTVDWLCGLYTTFKKRPKYKESYSFLM